MGSWVQGFIGIALLVAGSAPDAEDGEAFYENEIRPLLHGACVDCHGPDKVRSGLRVDSIDALLAGGARGPALVPGDPDASLLVRAISYEDPDLAMPERGKLPARDIAKLVRWISAGAPGPRGTGEIPVAAQGFDLEARRDAHWAFEPVHRPALSAGAGEGLSPIDAFLRERLDAEGLAPAPRAERSVQLRRLTFDLTGLPPTDAELVAFLTDDSPDAWEAAVDRALASPHYAERQARHWLDLVRYAETKGHEFDYAIANAWQYRDYLVRAFDADVPYDRLLAEHVAGDLLATPRVHPSKGYDESILGTGFWFLGEEKHSPVDIRAEQCDRVANQVDVFSKAFLGLTVACARCHDHKFDAISAEDYYGLAGFLLGSSYRQVRFETRAHNAPLAAGLERLEGSASQGLQRTYGSELVRAVEGSASYFQAALLHEAWTGEELAKDVDEPAADLVFEDFEGEQLAGWKIEGEAFGSGTLALADVPGHMGPIEGRGARFVNSYVPSGSDRPTGRLVSPSFVIRRDHIHFLLGGGDYDGETGVALELYGDRVRFATGLRTNRLAPARFDVRSLRGRTARLVVVDDQRGPWGQVGLDQIVFSDDPDAAVLRAQPAPALAAAGRRASARLASEFGLRPERLEAWVEALAAARTDERHPLHPWLDEDPVPRLFSSLLASERAPAPKGVADWRTLPLEDWIQDGFSFRPVRAGEAWLGDSPGAPITVAACGGAFAAPRWNGLVGDATSEREASSLSWTQAGRTLRTPTVTLAEPRLYYLVRGKGHVFVEVDAHRMLAGPLHEGTVRHFDEPRLTWVAHELSDYRGHRLHAEFTPTADSDGLLVVAAVQARTPPPLPSLSSWDLQALAGRTTPAARSQALEGLLVAAATQLARDEVEPGAAPWLAWITSETRLFATLEGVAEPYAELAAQRDELLGRIHWSSATAPALLDGDGLEEFVLVRGDSRSPAAPAPRRLLTALDPRPIEARRSARAALAERLTDPANPFVARVRVNRLWRQLFGRGLVASVDNFGVSGEAPTHPELLDWLAAEFVDQGWSTKRFLKRMLLSEAYRQSSTASDAAREHDPLNRWLSHASVRRLEGESIRDAILAASGTLDPERFGPPVPVHLTEFLEGRGRPGTSGPLDGAGRRSLYLAVRRNFLVPFFQVFDFPTPATTTGRRTTSNVPTQALALLNDPFVLAEAERFARRVSSVSTADGRVDAIFRAALARPAAAAEQEVALAFVEARAAELDVSALDPAAWSDLCHALFNTKEFFFLP